MHNRLALFLALLASLHASTALGLWHYERPQGNTTALQACWSDESHAYAVGLNGVAFRHTDGNWTAITDATLTGASLLAVHATPSGTVYAAGFRLGAPRFDTNGDGQISTEDTQSRYGVIFRYNGSAWEELHTGYGPESPLFASSFVGIWADGDGAVYFAGGSQRSSNTAPPSGVLLSYDGASFEPLVGASSNIPGINGIWGTPTRAYLACSSGTIVELNRSAKTITRMKSNGYAVDFRSIRADTSGTLYAVAETTSYGYIFRYQGADGWEPMGIDREDPPPLCCIAEHRGRLIASGSYGKTYYLDKTQGIWKEMLVGTQSHINGLSVAGDALIGASSTGELYRMTESDPTTAYILADPVTGLGTVVDGILTLASTLYDFSLGDIWKREWRFNNGSHHDPVPAYGVLYSHTAQGATTALYITGEGGAASSRELRISDCKGCSPHVEISETTIHLFIQSGHTTQNAIKTLLENSPAVSEVFVRHGDSPWVVSSKEYDSVFLTGGRDDEDLFINEEIGSDDALTTHTFKGSGAWEPHLTVYRENIAFLDGMIKIAGRRHEGIGPTVVIQDAGASILSLSATGVLGGLITIQATPGASGNLAITLINDPDATGVSSVLYGNQLRITLHDGVSTIQELIDHLNGLDQTIRQAAFVIDNGRSIGPDEAWSIMDYGGGVTLSGGSNHCATSYDGATVTVTIDSGITTTSDIAKALSAVKTTPGDTSLFAWTREIIPGKVWNTESHTNRTILPGVTTETATATVRVFEKTALGFTHTPASAKLTARVTFTDTSDPRLEIASWEWAIFRKVSDGYDTKATVKSESGTATVDLSALGTYDVGLKATLKDGSILTMVKEEALAIKGKNAGESSLSGANGCFIGAASKRTPPAARG